MPVQVVLARVALPVDHPAEERRRSVRRDHQPRPVRVGHLAHALVRVPHPLRLNLRPRVQQCRPMDVVPRRQRDRLRDDLDLLSRQPQPVRRPLLNDRRPVRVALAPGDVHDDPLDVRRPLARGALFDDVGGRPAPSVDGVDYPDNVCLVTLDGLFVVARDHVGRHVLRPRAPPELHGRHRVSVTGPRVRKEPHRPLRVETHPQPRIPVRHMELLIGVLHHRIRPPDWLPAVALQKQVGRHVQLALANLRVIPAQRVDRQVLPGRHRKAHTLGPRLLPVLPQLRIPRALLRRLESPFEHHPAAALRHALLARPLRPLRRLIRLRNHHAALALRRDLRDVLRRLRAYLTLVMRERDRPAPVLRRPKRVRNPQAVQHPVQVVHLLLAHLVAVSHHPPFVGLDAPHVRPPQVVQQNPNRAPQRLPRPHPARVHNEPRLAPHRLELRPEKAHPPAFPQRPPRNELVRLRVNRIRPHRRRQLAQHVLRKTPRVPVRQLSRHAARPAPPGTPEATTTVPLHPIG